MLYIHIPYCKSKCIYCDFYSGGNPQWESLVEALLEELSDRVGELPESLSSIYIGGGTPSLMPPDIFYSLIEGVNDILSHHGIRRTDDFEFTLEVNPEDVEPTRIDAWKRGGVNRVSMGVQTLDDELLSRIRRCHDAQRVEEAFALLRKSFKNLSVDIMFGIPGQTADSLKNTLGRIIDFHPEHVSAYSLMYEEGTALTVLRDLGKLQEVSEEEYLEFFQLISDSLINAGYEQYEISNYALPGYYSRHNSGYWYGRPYLGIGPSASSFDGKRLRRTNRPDLKSYLQGRSGITYEEETLSDEERREEVIFTELRTNRGIDLKKYEAMFGREALSVLTRRAKRGIAAGNLYQTESRMVLTREGIMVSDSIILDLI